jgi:hypothetical protein
VALIAKEQPDQARWQIETVQAVDSNQLHKTVEVGFRGGHMPSPGIFRRIAEKAKRCNCKAAEWSQNMISTWNIYCPHKNTCLSI